MIVASSEPAEENTTNKISINKEECDAAKGLSDLFVSELKDIYSIENELVKSGTGIIENAAGENLVKALTHQLKIIKEHLTRLEAIFVLVGENAETVPSAPIQELIKAVMHTVEKKEMGMIKNVAIISMQLKIAHYKMASYGTLCSFAKTLGENEAAALLHKNLGDEKDINEKLSNIIESIQFEMVDTYPENSKLAVLPKIKQATSSRTN